MEDKPHERTRERRWLHKDSSRRRTKPVEGVTDTNKEIFQKDRVRSRGKSSEKSSKERSWQDPMDLITIKCLVTGYDGQVVEKPSVNRMCLNIWNRTQF